MSELARYHRQILLPQIGAEGQEKLARARVLLVGCGALGCTIAEQLARAGIGFLRIVDRDIVELTNLQRQVLFDESDAASALPKAIAAAKRLRRINSSIAIEPHIADLDAGNAESFCDVDLILDGTDNVATRFLLNEISVKNGIPWIYGACVGTEGRVMTIRPGDGPCLRCIFREPPAPGELPTCDTAGVLGPIAAVVGAMQAMAAMKLIVGGQLRVDGNLLPLPIPRERAGERVHLSSANGSEEPSPQPSPLSTREREPASSEQLLSMDLWANRIHVTDLHNARRSDCPTCGLRRFEFLNDSASRAVQLCGRNAVQIRANSKIAVNAVDLATRLGPFGSIEQTPYFVRCNLRDESPLRLTVFLDGRTIVHGTSDMARAKSIHAKYVGA